MKEIEDNMNSMGSVSAEINYSSVVAHVGKGSNKSISEQTAALFDKQQFLVKKENKAKNDYYVQCHTYKSKVGGLDGRSHVATKSVLTKFAYNKFFTHTSHKQCDLQHKKDDNRNFVC